MLKNKCFCFLNKLFIISKLSLDVISTKNKAHWHSNKYVSNKILSSINLSLTFISLILNPIELLFSKSFIIFLQETSIFIFILYLFLY